MIGQLKVYMRLYCSDYGIRIVTMRAEAAKSSQYKGCVAAKCSLVSMSFIDYNVPNIFNEDSNLVMDYKQALLLSKPIK